MEKRWTNLVVIIVAIIIVYFVYTSFFAPSVDINEGATQIQSIWTSEGVDFSNTDSFYDLSEAQLQTVKSKLSGINAGLGASGEYLAMNVLLVDILLNLNTENNLNAELFFTDSTQYCAVLQTFEQRNAAATLKVSNAQELGQRVASFNASNPTQTELTQVFSFVDAKTLKEDLDFKINSFNSLEAGC